MSASGSRGLDRASHPAIVCAALCAAVAAVYVQTAGHSFVDIDDGYYVFRNARVLRGLDLPNVRWALTTLYFSNWHPLTWLSYLTDVSLFGPASPGAMHLVNAAIHAAAAAVLFLSLGRMTGAPWRSALVAALFALHPTRVESVAWISERKDVLSILFGALTLLAYERYARRPVRGRYVAVLLAYGASLASKAMLVTLPAVLLLLDAWPLRRVAGSAGVPEGAASRPKSSWDRLVLEKVPLVAMAAAVTVVGAVAQARSGAVSNLPLEERLANAVVAYGSYLGKLVWPLDLSVLYPYPPEGWPAWRIVASATLLVAATAGAILARRRAPWVTIGWFWFLGTLVPVIGIVQLGAQAMADRYTYFPFIGLFLAVAFSLPAPPGRWRLAAGGTAVGALAVLGVVSFRQVGLWADEERLYRHALLVTGPNSRMHAILASYLHAHGRTAEAYQEILEANRIWPGNPPDLTSLGVIARATGQLDVAEHALRDAVAAGPRYAPGWYALADLLRRTGRRAEAVEALRRVAELDPENGTARAELGIELHMAGRVEDAARAFEDAVRVAPDDFEVQRNAGVFGAMTGRWPFAAEALSRADRLRPGNPEIARRLAEARERARGGPN